MSLADDLAGVGARLAPHLLGLLFGAGAKLGEVLATGGEQPLGLLTGLGGESGRLLLGLGQHSSGLCVRLC
jgi:hypothetical protein